MTSADKPVSWLALRIIPAASRRAYVIAVPKRIVRLSTSRNRIKRLIRESIRLNLRTPPAGRMFRFSVERAVPRGLNLKDTERVIDRLMSGVIA